MTSRFDAAALLREYDDQALVRELARLFIATAGDQTAQVSAAVQRGDADALKTAAHRLRGGLLTLRAADAAERARLLESMGTSGDLAGAAEVAGQLGAEVLSLCTGAAAWLTEHDG
jgi:HPt (histidine-containing phosphotransfer) domain-containing protein